MYSASMVMDFSNVRKASRICHWVICGATTFEKILTHFWILVFMFWYPSGNMPACLPSIDTSWDFRLLSNNDFSVRRRELYFRVMETTGKSHRFFNLLAKFGVMLPLYCRKIAGLSWDRLFDALLVLFSIDLFCQFLSFLRCSSLFLNTIHLDTDFVSSMPRSFQALDRSSVN